VEKVGNRQTLEKGDSGQGKRKKAGQKGTQGKIPFQKLRADHCGSSVDRWRGERLNHESRRKNMLLWAFRGPWRTNINVGRVGDGEVRGRGS